MGPIKLIDLNTADKLREVCAAMSGKLDVSRDNDKDTLYNLIQDVRTNLTRACDEFTESVNRTVDAKMIAQADNEVGHTLFGNKVSVIVNECGNTRKVPLKFKKLHPEATLPKYAHEGDAGMDIFSIGHVELPNGIPVLIKTGLAAEIPDGYELQVRSRSGLALKGVSVENAPGTIDSKYRGEIGVILTFRNDKQFRHTTDGGTSRQEWYNVNKGDKIAQLVLSPVTFAEVEEVQELSVTDRGSGGFGSTGR